MGFSVVGAVLLLPIMLASNAALVFLIGRLGLRMVRREPRWTEPVLFAHHVACVLSAALSCTVVPTLVFMAFPIYVGSLDVGAAWGGLFVFSLGIGLFFQLPGHAAIREAGEGVDAALVPERRPVHLSRFRAGLVGSAVFAAGCATGAIVMRMVDEVEFDYWRSTLVMQWIRFDIDGLQKLRAEGADATIEWLERRLESDGRALERRKDKGGEKGVLESKHFLDELAEYRKANPAGNRAQEVAPEAGQPVRPTR